MMPEEKVKLTKEEKAIRKRNAQIVFKNFVGSRRMDKMIRKNKIRKARQK